MDTWRSPRARNNKSALQLLGLKPKKTKDGTASPKTKKASAGKTSVPREDTPSPGGRITRRTPIDLEFSAATSLSKTKITPGDAKDQNPTRRGKLKKNEDLSKSEKPYEKVENAKGVTKVSGNTSTEESNMRGTLRTRRSSTKKSDGETAVSSSTNDASSNDRNLKLEDESITSDGDSSQSKTTNDVLLAVGLQQNVQTENSDRATEAEKEFSEVCGPSATRGVSWASVENKKETFSSDDAGKLQDSDLRKERVEENHETLVPRNKDIVSERKSYAKKRRCDDGSPENENEAKKQKTDIHHPEMEVTDTIDKSSRSAENVIISGKPNEILLSKSQPSASLAKPTSSVGQRPKKVQVTKSRPTATILKSTPTKVQTPASKSQPSVSTVPMTPPTGQRSLSRQRKVPHKYRDFDVADSSSHTGTITTISPSAASGRKPGVSTEQKTGGGLSVWKIMQMKKDETEADCLFEEDSIHSDELFDIFEEIPEDTPNERFRTPCEARKTKVEPTDKDDVDGLIGEATIVREEVADAIGLEPGEVVDPQGTTAIHVLNTEDSDEMSQEDAVNLLMDVANSSRNRLASSDLEGVTFSLKEVPGDQVEIASQEDGGLMASNAALQKEETNAMDSELGYAACQVLSRVAEDVIIDTEKSAGKVIVVEGVHNRVGDGVRQGTLLTWRVQNLEENQQNLSPEELQESMTNSQNSPSDTFKVEISGPEAFEYNKRAKPGKYVILSAEHEALMNDLEPDDDISNHITVTPNYGNNLTMCNYCNTYITNRHHFRSHIRIHKDVVSYKPWKCPLCDYRANIKAQIGRHINIHGAMKPFICNACGRGFNFRQKLLQHMKYHLDIRDRECPICGLAFHEFKILKQHMQKIHGIKSGFDTLKRNGAGMENDADLQNFWQNKVLEVAAAKAKNEKLKNQASLEAETEDVRTEGSVEKPTEDESDKQNEATETLEEGELSRTEVATAGITKKGEKVTVHLSGGKKMQMEMKEGKVIVPHNLMKTHILNRRSGTLRTSRTIKCEENFKKGVRPGQILNAQNAKSKRKKYERKVTNIETVFEEYCSLVPATGGVESCVYYKCKMCTVNPVMFRNKTHFLQHLEKDHPTEKPWKCTLCDFSSRLRSGLISHEKMHNPEFTQECNVCGRMFHDKRKFQAHQRHHLNLREHGCTMCDQRFNERGDMLKHIRRVHATVFPYKCPHCTRAFAERAQLRRHMEQHDGGKRQCDVCNKFYRSQTSLQQHMKSHTCMFHCEICNKSFNSYSGFMAHKVMHDESYEGYKCNVCPQTLLTKGSLKRHLEVVHSKKRNWVCSADNCKKSYKSKKDLTNHLLSHNSSLHRCTQCDFKCKRPESMKIHMLRHNNSKRYRCHLCNKEYTQKHALDIHLRHHTGQMEGRCELCGREFLTKYGLMLHMKRRHIVQEPGELAAGGKAKNTTGMFICEECHAAYPSQDKLAIHILTEHMKQNWGSTSTDEGVAGEVEVDGSAAMDGSNVIVLAENSALASGSTVPLGSGRKYVSLLSNRLTQPLAQRVKHSEPSVIQSGNEGNVTVQHVLFDNTQNQKNVATLINPDTNEETLVTISDPQLSQELFVSMPTANFESLLPASSVSGSQDLASGQLQETYITIGQDGEVIDANSQPMIGGIVTTVLDLGTEIVPEIVEEQLVTETVEVPLSIEDGVTEGSEESQVITYDNLSAADDGTYVILQSSNPSH